MCASATALLISSVACVELPADLRDRAQELIGRGGRGSDIGRGLVRGMHGACGALRGLARRCRQRLGGRPHGGGTVGGGLQDAFDAVAERKNGAVDQASCAFLLEQRDARSSARRRSVMSSCVDTRPPPGSGRFGDCDSPAVRRLHGLVDRLAFGDLTLGVLDVLLGIPDKDAVCEVRRDEITGAYSRARPARATGGTSAGSGRCRRQGALSRRTCKAPGTCCSTRSRAPCLARRAGGRRRH